MTFSVTGTTLARREKALHSWSQMLRSFWLGLQSWREARRCPRQLALRESLSLGDKRALLVAEFEQQLFLIGITGSSVALLTALPNSPAETGTDETRSSRHEDKGEMSGEV